MTADEPTCWRFIVEEVGEAHNRHGFAKLELLLAFLRNEFAVDQDELDDKSNKKSSTEKKGEQP